MTNQEAINRLTEELNNTCFQGCCADRGHWTDCDFCEIAEAYDMAINALKADTDDGK